MIKFILLLGMVVWSAGMSALNVWVLHLSFIPHILLCAVYGVVYGLFAGYISYKYI